MRFERSVCHLTHRCRLCKHESLGVKVFLELTFHKQAIGNSYTHRILLAWQPPNIYSIVAAACLSCFSNWIYLELYFTNVMMDLVNEKENRIDANILTGMT